MELLVVIAIIGVLVSLMLPAIQAARESARHSSCQNNLRQIGLGMMNHDQTIKRLPWAIQAEDPNTHQTKLGSAFVQILPYLEENGLFRSYNPQQNPDEGANAAIAATNIPLFICPTMSHPDGALPKNGSASYGISTGSGACRNPIILSSQLPDPTNHNGEIVSPKRGKVRLNDISAQDGCSKTVLVGELDYGLANAKELSGGLINGGSTRWAMAYVGVTWASMAGDFNSDKMVHGFAEWETFRSDHSGGVYFVFCDGSTRFIVDETKPAILKRLAQRNDGLPIE